MIAQHRDSFVAMGDEIAGVVEVQVNVIVGPGVLAVTKPTSRPPSSGGSTAGARLDGGT